jgi:hypothetical protein
MFSRGLISSWVFVTFAGASLAQESSAYLDAPVVVGDHRVRFQKLADINGDGFMDAYSGWWLNDNYGSIRLTAFLNDGQGRLVSTWSRFPSVIPAHTDTWAFAAGDIDADGLADVVFGVGLEVQVLLTRSGGLSSTYYNGWLSGLPVTGLSLLDVDGDGLMEIAVLHGSLTILRFDAAGGANAFTPIGELALGAVGGELETTDVDGTGQADLMAWDATRVMLIPMQGARPQAPTTFEHRCTFPKAATGDLDGDGDVDVVVFDMGTYVVLRRSSATTFEREGPYSGGPARYLYDLNGDGFPDGACCGGGGDPSEVHNNNASIFRIALNDGTGRFGPAYEFPGLGSERLAGAADLDHDGDLDLVAGRCVYYAVGNLLDGVPRALPFVARPNAYADLEGDMDPDLEPGMTTQRNLGDGVLAPFTPVLPTPPPGKNWVGPGYPGDFDGDGDLDLVIGQYVNLAFQQMELLTNSGGGSFVDAGPAGPAGVNFTYGTSIAPRARDAIARDLDGDGDVDLVVTRSLPPASKIYLNDGLGNFTPGSALAANVVVRHVADMNGDGLIDLVGFYRASNNSWEIVILAGLGNANFSSGYHVYFSGSYTGASDVFDIGDADGDGDLDIVDPNTEDLYVFVNNGTPGGPLAFQIQQLVLQRAVEGDNSLPRGAIFNDVDMDGKLDIVCWPVGWYVYDAPNASCVIRRKADNTGYEAPTYQVLQPTGHLDIDGDGDEDLVDTHLHKNRCFESVAGGMRKQTAGGLAGAGGILPTLGASGPFRVGQSAEIVLTGATGGIPGVFYQTYLGTAPPPFPGGHHAATIYSYYPASHFTTSGTPGSVGEGRWSLPFTVPGYVAGKTKVYHVDLHDPGAPTGLARSNKLYVTYGP